MGKVKQVTGIDVAAPVKAVQSAVSSIGNATGLSPALTKVFQPVEKAVVQPVGQGLASLDKAVGKAIPGGWGTLASIAGSAMGVPTPYMVGLGALQGSGVTKKGGSFNLQGAMLGGAMAYASSELAEYARGASDSAIKGATEGATQAAGDLAQSGGAYTLPGSTDAIANLNASQGWTGAGATDLGSSIPQGAINSANAATQAAADAASRINPVTGLDYAATGSGLTSNAVSPPTVMDRFLTGDIGGGISQIGSNISEGVSNLGSNIAESAKSAYGSSVNALDKATSLDTYTGALEEGTKNAGDTMSGAKNLFGLGDASAKQAASLAAKAGTMNPALATGAILYTGMGLAALQEQKKYLQESLAANNISQDEYNQALASINAEIAVAEKAVAENPLKSSAGDISSISPGKTLYEKEFSGLNTLYDKNPTGGTLYGKTPVQVASGGMINQYASGGIVTNQPNVVTNPPDDQTGEANRSPMTQLDAGANGQLGQAFSQMGSPSILKNLFGLGLGNLQQPQPASSSPQNAFNDSYEPSGSPFGSGMGLGSTGVNSQGAFPLQGQYGIVKMAEGGDVKPKFGTVHKEGWNPPINDAPISNNLPNIEQAILGKLGPVATSGFVPPMNAVSQPSSNNLSMPELLEKARQLGLMGVVTRNTDLGFDYANPRIPIPYAAGGMTPRFLSGGGDGMSDSIKASINGTQEARLADGEFVIPADVVSHLGNGSSKAGAKQLYSMMDRVRSARTGTKKQGKQINPRKFMTA